MIAVIDVAAHRGYTLSVQQPPPLPRAPSLKLQAPDPASENGNRPCRIPRSTLEHLCTQLNQLPEKKRSRTKL